MTPTTPRQKAARAQSQSEPARPGRPSPHSDVSQTGVVVVFVKGAAGEGGYGADTGYENSVGSGEAQQASGGRGRAWVRRRQQWRPSRAATGTGPSPQRGARGRVSQATPTHNPPCGSPKLRPVTLHRPPSLLDWRQDGDGGKSRPLIVPPILSPRGRGRDAGSRPPDSSPSSSGLPTTVPY